MKRSEWIALGGTVATLAGLAYAIARDRKGSLVTGSEARRAAMVAAAKSQVGKADLAAYFADAAPQYVNEPKRPEWCGIFALWALHQAGMARGVQWKTGTGFLLPQKLPQVSVPRPGDIAYFDKARHHAIVERVHGDQVDLINGNGQGGVVSLSTAPLSKARAYYSIEKWAGEK